MATVSICTLSIPRSAISASAARINRSRTVPSSRDVTSMVVTIVSRDRTRDLEFDESVVVHAEFAEHVVGVFGELRGPGQRGRIVVRTSRDWRPASADYLRHQRFRRCDRWRSALRRWPGPRRPGPVPIGRCRDSTRCLHSADVSLPIASPTMSYAASHWPTIDSIDAKRGSSA